MALDNPTHSPVVVLTDQEILAKILVELRIQTMLMAEEFHARDTIASLRSEILNNSSDL